MKKKLITIVAAFVLCLSMGITAVAAPSPSYPSKPNNEIKSVTTVINGKEITLVLGNSNEAQVKALQAFLFDWEKEFDKLAEKEHFEEDVYWDKWAEAREKWIVSSMEKYLNLTCKKTNGYFFRHLSLPEGVKMPAGGIDITIKEDIIHADDEIILVHIKSDGTFERIDATVKEGSVTGHFTSLSPVIVIFAEGVKDLSETATSPKTGDTNMAAVAVFAGVAMLSGLVYFSRKRKAF